MKIIEYILDPQDEPRSFHPKTIPSYVTDGGWWVNPDGETMIGVGVGSLPDSVTIYGTLEALQTRQRAIHAKYPMAKEYPDITEYKTDDEVDAVIKWWWDTRTKGLIVS
jgi:flavin-dependent dehydrogenase